MATITLNTGGKPIEVTTTVTPDRGEPLVTTETVTAEGRFFYVDATAAVTFRELPRS